LRASLAARQTPILEIFDRSGDVVDAIDNRLDPIYRHGFLRLQLAAKGNVADAPCFLGR
jgi:hypothetical protein